MKELSYGQSRSIAGYFIRNCSAAYYYNLVEETAQVLQDRGLLSEGLPGTPASFRDGLLLFVNVYVHPDDRQSFLEMLDTEKIRETLRRDESFSFEFREISIRAPGIYRAVVMRGEDEDHAVLCVMNVTEELQREVEQSERARVQNELINQMAGKTSVYLLYPKRDEFKVLFRSRYLEETYGGEASYSASVARYIAKDVHELDRDRMRKATAKSELLTRLRKEREVVEIYRDVSSGVSHWYKMRAVRISDEEILIGFADIDKEYYDNAIHGKIEDDYFGMYIADLDTQIFKILKLSPWYKTGKVGDVAPFVPMLTAFAARNEGETREFFENLCSLDYIRNAFAREDKISYTYKSRFVEGDKWVTAECLVLSRHEDGSPAIFALGFRLADSLFAEKQELQMKLRATRIVLETLTEDFGCVNYVEFTENRENDVSVNYRVSSLLKKLIPGWEQEKSFPRKLQLLKDKVVYEPDRDWFTEATKRETIFRNLEGSDTYFVNFRTYFNERVYYYQMKVSAVRRDGTLIGMVVGIHSVDESVRKEMAVQEQLEAALESAEVANRSKTSFLFNMSHDIRTPMNAIRGFTAMAKKYLDDRGRVEDYLDKIDISGQQLLVLVNQVLEMARIESGRFELDEKPVSVREQFESMVTVLAEQAEFNGQDFHYSLSDVRHNNVYSDEARMSSITLNIVGNAMKYTPEGGRIDFELREVPARKPGFATFVFTVADTGIGMSEDFLKQLFEPFSRESNSIVSHIQGTGLGMSIVKKLVDLLGGEISVQSAPGRGTRFDVTIDFRIDDKAGAAAEPVRDVSAVSFEGRRVLLVEDNELNREIATDILEEHGLTVENAEDGDVAVDQVKAAFDRGDFRYYDFVLMDVQMPRMNGYDATRAIRALPVPEGVHIPIIAMTANAFEEDRRDAFEAGMDEHLAKPIDMQKLFATLARFL